MKTRSSEKRKTVAEEFFGKEGTCDMLGFCLCGLVSWALGLLVGVPIIVALFVMDWPWNL